MIRCGLKVDDKIWKHTPPLHSTFRANKNTLVSLRHPDAWYRSQMRHPYNVDCSTKKCTYSLHGGYVKENRIIPPHSFQFRNLYHIWYSFYSEILLNYSTTFVCVPETTYFPQFKCKIGRKSDARPNWHIKYLRHMTPLHDYGRNEAYDRNSSLILWKDVCSTSH